MTLTEVRWVVAAKQALKISHKLLIYWDSFPPWFTESGPKNRTYPVSSRCVDENGLFMLGVRSQDEKIEE